MNTCIVHENRKRGWICHLTVFILCAIVTLSTNYSREALLSPFAQEGHAEKKEFLNADDFLLSTADTFFKKGNKKTYQTKYYTIVSDCPNQESLKKIADSLEYLREVFIAIFGGAFPLRKEASRATVILFNKSTSYYYFTFKIGAPYPGTSLGYYIPGTEFIISHFEQGYHKNFSSTLLHESVHQLNDCLLYSPDVRKSIWVNEGLAIYFAHTEMASDGSLIFGKIDKGPTNAEGLLNILKKAMKKKKHKRVWELIECRDREEFYDDETGIYYAESWLLIHFLLHHQGGKYRKSFVKFLRDEIEGNGGLESFKKIFGDDLRLLDKEFRNYVLRL